MNARSYTLKSRAVAAQRTRARILAATRDILGSEEGVAVFSLEAVARAAGVTRVTVYNQFGSKHGLVEALSDDLAVRAEIGARLGAAFQSATALDALDGLIAAFAHFWTVDRVIIRRLHGIAALDPEIGRGDAERNERRRGALTAILRRLQAERGIPHDGALTETVALLHMLTSFEAMDQLAGPDRSPIDALPVIRRLAWQALSIDGDPGTSSPVMSSPPPVMSSPPPGTASPQPGTANPQPVMASGVETSPPSDTPPLGQRTPPAS